MNTRYEYSFIIALLFVIFPSCSDYLDKEPDDQLTLEMVFNDKSRVEEWLAGVYNGMPDPNDGYNRDIDAMGDDLNPSIGWEQFNVSIIAYQKGNWSSSSHWTMDYWHWLPPKIRSAYIFLENVKSLREQLLSEQEVTYMKAECRFLIAFYHHILLQYYGAIPVHRGLIDPFGGNEAQLVSQEPFDDVVAWIEEQYTEAAKILPPVYADTKKYGRITSIICLAAKAKLLQFAASPLVNGNSDFRGYVNSKGVEIFNFTYSGIKWEKAAAAYKELLDAAHEAGHKLYYEYTDDGTIDPFMSYQNVMMKGYDDGNKEILFACVPSNVEPWDNASQPRGTGGAGGLGVTQRLVDDFFMNNGKRPILGYNEDGSPVINQASGYTESGFSTSNETRKTKWKEVQGNPQQEYNNVTLAGTYNMYVGREARFYISVLYNDCWFRRENRFTQFYFGAPDGGPTHDAPQNGYLVRKKVHPDADPRNSTFPYRPGIIYRLADFYLGYAEMLNEINYAGNKEIALGYINQIRERAGIPKYGDALGEVAVPASKEEMRDAILLERRVELNCEAGNRFNDIRRWKMGHLLSGKFYGMNFQGTEKSDDKNDPNAFYVRKPYLTRRFISYWMPVPQDEMDINPNLRQLPGW
jgi:hypothetical protein